MMAPMTQSEPSDSIARQRLVDDALARARSVESLEDAYRAWLALRLEHAGLVSRAAEQRRRLDDEGAFLLGTVRSAARAEVTVQGKGPRGSSLAPREEQAIAFLAQAEARLRESRAALEAQVASEAQVLTRAFEELRALVLARAKARSELAPPRLHLRVRPIAGRRAVLHLDRLSGDAPVVLCFVLTGRVPSRYEFLSDESVEELALGPAPLYADEGVGAAEVHAPLPALASLLDRHAEVLPIRGWIPLPLQAAGGAPEPWRLMQRGPVLEVERLEEGGARGVLSREEAEKVSGALLLLELSGRIALTLSTE